MSQFEEIRADGGTLAGYSVKSKDSFASIYNPVEMLMTSLLIITRYNYGEEGEARLYEEGEARLYNDRLLYPEVRRNFALQTIKGQETSVIPSDREGWDIIPPRIVYPFVAAHAEVPQLATSRRERFSTEQIEQIPAIKDFFKRNRIHSSKNQMLLLEEVYHGRSSMWQRDEEKDVIPYTRLSKKQEERLIALLSEVHHELSVQELQAGLESFWKTSDREEKKRILKQLSFLYPWSAPVYLEFSIFYDQSGDLQLAWDPILTALVLNPENPFIWQSLAVILHRLGNDVNANFSLAIHEYLKERENK